MQDLYSFDIFDTCLVRTCGKPVNLLYTLAYKVLGADAEFVLVRDFVRTRHNAEVDLFKDGIEAATIEQIYDRLDFSYYTTLPSKQIMVLEMSLETETLVPVAEVVKKIEECRHKGRVAFISDMYFSGSFLRGILEKHGLIKEDEQIYVSCEYQATKRTGKLFDVVKEKEGIPFSRWTHFGDDFNNDYSVPKHKGIKTVKINHDFQEYELLCEKLSPYASNKIAGSVFAGILRATRLQMNLKDDGGFLTGVMSGLLLPFVAACLQDAQNRGIKRLFFASRDAYVMFLVAKQFSPLFAEIELKYIYLSTRTIYPTLIEKGTEVELHELLSKIVCFKPKSILKMLGFEDGIINSLKEKFDVDCECRLGDATAKQMIEWLCQKEQIETWKNNGLEKRELLLGYLRQEGFISGDGCKVGLVDVGWRCSSQLFLSKLIGRNVLYYYFGVAKVNFRADEMGRYNAAFFMDLVNTIHPKLLECYICKNLENTVVGYKRTSDGRISVGFADEIITQAMNDDFLLRKQVLERSAFMFEKYNFLIRDSQMLFDTCSCQILKNVLATPSKQISSFLVDKMVWDHYVDKQSIIRKMYPFDMLSLFYAQWKNGIIPNKYSNLWIEACLSYTYGSWIPIFKFFVRRLRVIKKILK